MSRDSFNVPFADDVTLLGILAVIIWLLLVRISLRGLLDRAALTVSGYFRRRPDPAAERTLRAAFAELDAGLAEILGDRTATDQPGPTGCHGPGCEGCGAGLRPPHGRRLAGAPSAARHRECHASLPSGHHLAAARPTPGRPARTCQQLPVTRRAVSGPTTTVRTNSCPPSAAPPPYAPTAARHQGRHCPTTPLRHQARHVTTKRPT